MFDDSLAQTAKEMLLIMYAADGVGLAAPQVRLRESRARVSMHLKPVDRHISLWLIICLLKAFVSSMNSHCVS